MATKRTISPCTDGDGVHHFIQGSLRRFLLCGPALVSGCASAEIWTRTRVWRANAFAVSVYHRSISQPCQPGPERGIRWKPINLAQTEQGVRFGNSPHGPRKSTCASNDFGGDRLGEARLLTAERTTQITLMIAMGFLRIRALWAEGITGTMDTRTSLPPYSLGSTWLPRMPKR